MQKINTFLEKTSFKAPKSVRHSTSSILAIACILALACIPAAMAEDYDALWFTDQHPAEDRKIKMAVHTAEQHSIGIPLELQCELISRQAYQSTELKLALHDEQDILILESTMVLDLYAGKNQALFNVDTSQLPIGTIEGTLSLNYTDSVDPLVLNLELIHVSKGNFTQRIEESRKRLSAIQATLSSPDFNHPRADYLQVDAAIASHTQSEFAQRLAAAQWTIIYRKLLFMEQTLDRIEAEMVFGTSSHTAKQRYTLTADDSMLSPRIGIQLNQPLKNWQATLAQLKLDFMVHDVPVNASLTEEATQHYNTLVQSNDKQGIHTLLNFSAPQYTQSTNENAPFHGEKEYREQLAKALPHFSGANGLIGITFTQPEVIQFQDTQTHRDFINFVRRTYPDRQELNRIWRAHLGSYDEITMWGKSIYTSAQTEIPDHSYQNRWAYQADWQNFHRSKVSQYLQHFLGSSTQLNSLPQSIVVSDAYFDQGESRMGIDQEALLKHSNFITLTTQARDNDSVYALDYPNQTIHYAFLKSLQPQKPLYDIQLNVDFSDAEPNSIAPIIESTLWESFMAGLNSAQVNLGVTGQDAEEALAAVAHTHLDLQRLRPLLHTYQESPAVIGILFSQASKIFEDGDPHLKSVWDAYEGATFGGYKVRFITEDQCNAGALDDIQVLIIPKAPALDDATFEKLAAFIESGRPVARAGTPIPYNEKGHSRNDVLPNTGNTVLVRGMNLPTEYLHAIDALIQQGDLDPVPHTINNFGYPLEGVKSRYIEVDGQPYLYIINLRKDAVNCHISGNMLQGWDLIREREITFPRSIAPLEPMLIALERQVNALQVAVTP